MLPVAPLRITRHRPTCAPYDCVQPALATTTSTANRPRTWPQVITEPLALTAVDDVGDSDRSPHGQCSDAESRRTATGPAATSLLDGWMAHPFFGVARLKTVCEASSSRSRAQPADDGHLTSGGATGPALGNAPPPFAAEKTHVSCSRGRARQGGRLVGHREPGRAC
jgi:hypothetical protein